MECTILLPVWIAGTMWLSPIFFGHAIVQTCGAKTNALSIMKPKLLTSIRWSSRSDVWRNGHPCWFVLQSKSPSNGCEPNCETAIKCMEEIKIKAVLNAVNVEKKILAKFAVWYTSGMFKLCWWWSVATNYSIQNGFTCIPCKTNCPDHQAYQHSQQWYS